MYALHRRRRHLLGRPIAAILASIALAACDDLLTASPDSADVFDAPLPGLTNAELAAFVRGDAAFGRQSQPVGNVVLKRTAGLAERHAALGAAAGLFRTFSDPERGVDLVEIAHAFRRGGLRRTGVRNGHELLVRVSQIKTLSQVRAKTL